MMISLFLLLLDMPFISFALLSNNRNEHRPHDVSWLITDAYGQTLNSTFNRTIVDSWFPDLYFDYGQMLLGVTAYNHSSDAPSPSPGFVHKCHFYVCPGHMTTLTTDIDAGVSDYFCKHWDCVSSGNIWWDPPMKSDYIRLQKGSKYVPCPGYGRRTWEEDDDSTGWDDWPLCNPVKLSFTSEGRKYKGWDRGVTWGGRIYAAGYDYGNIFTITRRVVVQYSFLQPRASTPHPLLSLLNSTFLFLNPPLDFATSGLCCCTLCP
uniref:Uncharacterized protein n=1 Tax=Naja naja TaxID=35670 RepID=A0A8C6X5U8_NAJNA